MDQLSPAEEMALAYDAIKQRLERNDCSCGNCEFVHNLVAATEMRVRFARRQQERDA